MAKILKSILLTLSAVIVIAQGLRCRVDSNPRSVEEFEDIVRICLRTSVSPQDKSKNKQSWNNRNNNRNNKGKKKGKFGKDSEEEDDDYEDDYGEESKQDSIKDKKNGKGNKNDRANKGDSGASRIGTRYKRLAQYDNRRDYSNYGDDRINYGDNRQYSQGYDGMQGGYVSYRGSEGNYDTNRNENNNQRYYGDRRFKREPQFPDRGYDNDRQDGGGGIPGGNNYDNRRGSNGYNNGGNRDGNYGGYSNQFGGNGNPYGGDRGGYGGGPAPGGYGLQNNNWSGNGNTYQGGRGGRNSTKRSSSPLKNVQPCVIHCILRQKRMLDEDGTPDKSLTMKVMNRNIKDSELRDFIQDSVNECFDNIETEETDGKCDMSKSLMMCLEDKGKQNCEDWESAGPSTNTDKWFFNSNDFRPSYQRPQQWGY